MDRSLILLNERGDTTITWEPAHDDDMEALIAAKMAAGVMFYIIAQRKAGQKGRTPKPKALADAADARKHRALSIPDADFSKFVLDGKGTAVLSTAVPAEPIATTHRAKTPKDVATGHSVGVQPRRGG